MTDPNPQTRLAKMEAWKAAFPATDFELERLQTYLATYETLNRASDVLATARQMLDLDPENLAALTSLVMFITHDGHGNRGSGGHDFACELRKAIPGGHTL
jgi:hypothetical protein